MQVSEDSVYPVCTTHWTPSTKMTISEDAAASRPVPSIVMSWPPSEEPEVALMADIVGRTLAV
jgi:hypothetical protein